MATCDLKRKVSAGVRVAEIIVAQLGPFES